MVKAASVATIWQGDPPPSINLIGAYNLASNRRVFIWEGESSGDVQFMDRFNEVGVLETHPAFDRTAGWRAAFAKDLEGFAKWPRERGRDRVEIESAVELRRRGMEAPNREAARAEALQWRREQAVGGPREPRG